MSEEQLIAACRNTYGGSVSALTTSKAALLASLVVAAGGSASAVLHSEAEMLARLTTALGASSWSAATKSAVDSLAEAVALSEGGGGEPAWVPEGAVAHDDFLGDRAWTQADGEVTIASTFNENFDTELITENGYESDGSGTFDGLTSYFSNPAGFTVVVEGSLNDADNLLRLIANNAEVGVYLDDILNVYTELQDEPVSETPLANDTDAKFAITVKPTSISFSDRGAAVVSFAIDEVTEFPAWEFNSVAKLGGGGMIFYSFTVFPAQDDADLPSLSE